MRRAHLEEVSNGCSERSERGRPFGSALRLNRHMRRSLVLLGAFAPVLLLVGAAGGHASALRSNGRIVLSASVPGSNGARLIAAPVGEGRQRVIARGTSSFTYSREWDNQPGAKGSKRPSLPGSMTEDGWAALEEVPPDWREHVGPTWREPPHTLCGRRSSPKRSPPDTPRRDSEGSEARREAAQASSEGEGIPARRQRSRGGHMAIR